MKRSFRKLFALITVMILSASVLSACGGSSGSEGSTDGGADTSAEANAGIRGVVITVPEGWTVSGGQDDNYLNFSRGGKGYSLGLSATNSADLERNKEFDDSITTTDIKEYFDKYNKDSEEFVSKGEVELSETKICDADGKYYKRKAGDGYVNLEATWILDDNIYILSMFNGDNYDPVKGEMKDEPQLLSDDEIAMFEEVMAGAKAGDGNALLRNVLTADSIGSYAFDIPEGYSISALGENHLSLKKEGNEAEITVSITTEDDLRFIENENGEHPASLEEAWKDRTKYLADEEKMEIAGCEGAMYEQPAEDGRIYSVYAEFIGEDGIYNISMSTDAWDTKGNIREGATELTKDEIEAFESFVKSFRAK